jgi:hypothetical protein
MDSQDEKKRVAGVLAVQCNIVGWVSLLLAGWALVQRDEPNWWGVGTCLIASALAFGLAANAVLRR